MEQEPCRRANIAFLSFSPFSLSIHPAPVRFYSYPHVEFDSCAPDLILYEDIKGCVTTLSAQFALQIKAHSSQAKSHSLRSNQNKNYL